MCLLSFICHVLFLFREPFPTSKNIPIDRLLAMISRLLVLNSKSLSKTARANFGIVNWTNEEGANINFPCVNLISTTDLGIHHPRPSGGRIGCFSNVGGRLQEPVDDSSDNCYEPFRSSATVDLYSTWQASGCSWETLRVKTTSDWQIVPRDF